jgi:hypothetical protein
MDVDRKRKAKEKLKSEAAKELMREAARRKADNESETGFQAEAAALMKCGDRIRVVENGRLTSQQGQVKFVGKVTPRTHTIFTPLPLSTIIQRHFIFGFSIMGCWRRYLDLHLAGG